MNVFLDFFVVRFICVLQFDRLEFFLPKDF